MKPHPFLPNSVESTIEKMLKDLNVSSIDDLFRDIPSQLLLNRELRIPRGLNEFEAFRKVEELLGKNQVSSLSKCFLGGGVWPHYVPAAVDEISSRSEFYTSYTQYQPEFSQGMLQALFEYQSLICDLTSMDVANSSVYDWASAVGEAARMAVRATKRRKILVARNVGPQRADVLNTYCKPADIDVALFDFEQRTGRANLSQLRNSMTDDIAGVYIENPNFFGLIEEEIEDLGRIVHEKKGLLIAGIDPSSLGIVKPPGEYEADIVVGEGQPLGLHMNFGGPVLGILATRDEPTLLRQLPGRIMGMTTEKEGERRGFSMIMQAREQHIRRESATSNICTNEALLAVRAAVYMALLGPEGFRELGRLILSNSHYAQERLARIPGVKAPIFEGSFFKDLAVKLPDSTNAFVVYEGLAKRGICAGLPLETEFPTLRNTSLFSFTEIHSPQDIDLLAESLETICK
ncbi:MAG: aminomethyl-transferring glycine dehydrogenase subunit GcvPA [Candidatus Bathyarchaeia archaeon]